jgi:hypothetical protein
MSGGPLHRSDENQAEPYVWRSTKTYQPEDIGGRTYSVVTQQWLETKKKSSASHLTTSTSLEMSKTDYLYFFKSSGWNFCSQATVASFSSTASFTMAANSWSDTAPATS